MNQNICITSSENFQTRSFRIWAQENTKIQSQKISEMVCKFFPGLYLQGSDFDIVKIGKFEIGKSNLFSTSRNI